MVGSPLHRVHSTEMMSTCSLAELCLLFLLAHQAPDTPWQTGGPCLALVFGVGPAPLALVGPLSAAFWPIEHGESVAEVLFFSSSRGSGKPLNPVAVVGLSMIASAVRLISAISSYFSPALLFSLSTTKRLDNFSAICIFLSDIFLIRSIYVTKPSVVSESGVELVRKRCSELFGYSPSWSLAVDCAVCSKKFWPRHRQVRRRW